MISPEEYMQLKAFARIDGAWLAVLWIGCFAAYVAGLTNPLLQTTALLLVLSTPFFVASRLRKFRNGAREGIISFRRGFAYSLYVFFYGSLLLALAQYVYFAFIDQGYILSKFTEAVASAEGQQVIKTYGMADIVKESIDGFAALRPIDFALNMLTVNLMAGLMLSLPIAALTQRKPETGRTSQ